MNNHLCEICGRIFSVGGSLRRHIESTHNVRRHDCHVCGRRFSRSDNLRRHVTTVHAPTNEPQRGHPFRLCPTVFPSPEVLHHHIQVDHAASPTASTSSASSSGHHQVECNQCGRSFQREEHLRRHVRSVHARSKRHHFPQRGQLAPAHRSVPRRRQRFHCDFCDNGFSRRFNQDQLQAHNCPVVRNLIHNHLPSTEPRPGPSTEPQPEPRLGPSTEPQPEPRPGPSNEPRPGPSTEPEDVGMAGAVVSTFELVEWGFHRRLLTYRLASPLEHLLTIEEALVFLFQQVLDLVTDFRTSHPSEEGRAFIPLPKAIADTHAVVNVQNDDDRCFMYAILAKFALQNPQRTASYTLDIIARYDWTDLHFPVSLKEIKIFERHNAISVTVYGINRAMVGRRPDGSPKFKDTVYPLKICRREWKDHRDMLYVMTDGNSHYAYTTDLSRLVRHQLTNRENRIHICKRCFTYFDNRPNKLGLTGTQRLEEHGRYCYANAPIHLDMSKNTKIKFKHPEFSRRERFCVYADFECSLQPVADYAVQVPPGVRPISMHVPYAFAYQIIDSLGHKEFEPRVYFGADASKVFKELLRLDVGQLWEILFSTRVLQPLFTDAETAGYLVATHCYLCDKEFSEEDPKVRDLDSADVTIIEGSFDNKFRKISEKSS